MHKRSSVPMDDNLSEWTMITDVALNTNVNVRVMSGEDLITTHLMGKHTASMRSAPTTWSRRFKQNTT